MTNEKDKDSLDTFARTTAPDLGIPAETCLVEDAPDPCTIVIMGASGDLTERKIIPALFRLYVNGATPDPFTIVGCARTDMDDQSFRVKMKKALGEAEEIDSSRLDDFAAFLHYRRIDYGDQVFDKRESDLLPGYPSHDLQVHGKGLRGSGLVFRGTG
jgi:glucose-6-phosphate 1-dehydrogenase